MDICYYKTPVGNIEIICKEDALVSLKFVDFEGNISKETSFIKEVKKQLDEYFSGKRKNFNLKIGLQGTDFQKHVWNELKKIPYGKSKSYSEIAEAISKPNAKRAVGSACNKNPVAIIIPCHRIISKNGALGGYAYGNKIKQKLLKIEKLVK